MYSAASSSTYHYVGVVATISVWNDPSLSSSSVIASSPKSRQNGANLVVLVLEILCPQTKVTSSCAHFPFVESYNAFDIIVKMRPFAHLTTPLLLG